MKKKYILFIIAIVLLTGCTKKLNCTNQNESYKEELSIVFENNKATNSKLIASHNNEASYKIMCSLYKSNPTLENQEIICNDENKEIIINNYEVILNENAKNYKELKKYLEKNDFSCK